MTATTEMVSALPVAGHKVTGPDLADVVAPFSHQVIGRVPVVTGQAVTEAIAAASAAMGRGLPAYRRAEILDNVAAALTERRDELARLLCLEVAKPLTAARVEIDRAVQTIKYSAVEARTLTGATIVMDGHPAGVGHTGWTIRVPVGVIGAITPFNFPFNLAAHKVGPAIAAGCGVVLKPPRAAPLTALALARVCYDAGLPPEWLSVVVGPSSELGEALITDDRVAMITFTGSSQVGWQLAARAPRKHVALELGNSTPVIICPDADLERAAATLSGSAFGFAGQSCISVQRIIVHESVQERFSSVLVKAAQAKRVGDPLDENTDVGPLIDAAATERVLDWVAAAAGSGAELATGGALDPAGRCVQPTVLTSVPVTERVWSAEVFGPVVSLRSYSDLDEAFALANGTDYGLQAGIYTASLDVALTAAEKLRFGGVTVNETPTFRVDQMPYGGTKESGNTREGPHYTVRAMTEERMIVVAR
jgi:acyl-CoA reductase-like NAD-dependent aldehyde dehydrogenase